MDETVVQIGKAGRMLGVLSAPDGESAPNAPVVLMFNAGFLHHVGPFRLWVEVARELAARNIPSLRFDLNGLGDSAPASNPDIHQVQLATENLIDAMNLVESRLGLREFIVFGLCSGADYAHPAAKADARIRGVVFIDGYGYRTKSYWLYQQLNRFTSPRRWKSLIKRSLARDLSEREKAQELAPELMDDTGREFPTVDQVQSEILAFLQEGRRLHYIYTAGVPEYYNHEHQFWEMFPRLRPQAGLSCRYYPTTDHTFSLVSEREELKSALLGFVKTQSSTK